VFYLLTLLNPLCSHTIYDGEVSNGSEGIKLARKLLRNLPMRRRKFSLPAM
jgi:hypothetical protein